MFTFPISFFSSSVSNSQYSSKVLSFSPARYYRFEETSGTTIFDSSGNNRNATISGTYTLNQAGSLSDNSKAIYVNNGITQTELTTIPSTNYTIIVRAKTSSSDAGICVFFDNDFSYSPGLYLRSGKLEAYFYVGSTFTVSSTATYNDNNWHSFAFSIGSNGIRVYADGSLVANNVFYTSSVSFSGYWFIGKTITSAGSVSPINGYIDEFSYFNTQLTDTNILEIHQAI